MLRGPQTAAELRAQSERLHRFSDVSSVEGYLEELASAAPEPFVVRLAVQPGSRESRWAHALCGRPAAESSPLSRPREASHERLAPASATVDASAASESLLARLDALEQRIALLEAELRQWRSGATP
jgi:uncharacterized protein YceH (UPF0502 family)